ncbi:SDR family oxidoreductase [Geodermatophilus sp. SYSU D00742]
MTIESDLRARPSRTVLVTGGSGVVGQALLPRLLAPGPDGEPSATRVVALTRRRPLAHPGVTCVHGDVTAPRLGLGARDHAHLADAVDVVVHAAAVTVFDRSDEDLAATNVEGTRRVLQFAADAGATVHHVSTAFLHPDHSTERPDSAVGYAVTKRAAEQVVEDSGVPHVVVRPSIVVGDSRTGAVSAFQGVYQVADALLRGQLPVLPFDGDWPLDLVPCDVVADAIARLVEHGVAGGQVWVTAGERALTLAEGVDVLAAFAAAAGVPLRRPRFVPPTAPGGAVELLRQPERQAVAQVRKLFQDYLWRTEPFPSSLPELAAIGVAPLPDPRTTLSRGLRYWHATRTETRTRGLG